MSSQHNYIFIQRELAVHCNFLLNKTKVVTGFTSNDDAHSEELYGKLSINGMVFNDFNSKTAELKGSVFSVTEKQLEALDYFVGYNVDLTKRIVDRKKIKIKSGKLKGQFIMAWCYFVEEDSTFFRRMKKKIKPFRLEVETSNAICLYSENTHN